MEIKLLEDNAGGLHLTDGVDVYSYPNDEAGGNPQEEIMTFQDWKADAQPEIRKFSQFEYKEDGNMVLVALYADGIFSNFPHRMGSAAKHYFGLDK